MTKKEIMILAGAILVVAVGVVVGVATRGDTPPPAGAPQVGTPPVVQPSAPTPRDSFYKSSVPSNAALSTAVAETPVALHGDGMLKVFDLTVHEAGFTPNSITARRGDVVQIRITASGGDYDVEFPYLHLYQTVRSGETKPIGFSVDFTGTTDFLCRDFCGAHEGVKGTFIAIP